jgi:hypothetical protein
MTYTLNVTNEYYSPLTYHNPTGKGESSSIHKNMPAKFQKLGNFRLTIPGTGEVNFIDIAQRHIANFSKASWGVLISYQGMECEFRYEGEGELNIKVNDIGQVEINGNGSLIQTDLPSFVIK